MQTLSLGSPLRYDMDVILGIFLKGVGIGELWPQALALAGIGALFRLGRPGVSPSTIVTGSNLSR